MHKDWLAYRDSGEDFGESDVERASRALQDSVDRMVVLLTRPSAYSTAIQTMWEAMREREDRLHAKFFAA